MDGLFTKAGEDLTITRKLGDGTTMTIKSPNGSRLEMSGLLSRMVDGPVTSQSSNEGYQGGGMIGGNYYGPTHDNVPINANPGEFVLNVPASQNPQFKPVIEQMNNWGRQQLANGGYTGEQPHELYGSYGPANAGGHTDSSGVYPGQQPHELYGSYEDPSQRDQTLKNTRVESLWSSI